MAKKQIDPDGEMISLHDLGLENYEIVEVGRDELKGAPYNPRVLGEAERRKLRDGLKRHGLVAPITWNRKTGNVVGGHQRLGQLDALAGTKHYRLRVAAIDVDDGREKELNILLNNPNAQGDWDMEALETLLRDETLELEGAGFDDADLYRMFGDSIAVEREPDKLDELAQRVRDVKSRYDEIQKRGNSSNREDFYIVVVFRDAKDCTDFLRDTRLDDNRYQSGRELRRLCGLSKDGS